MKNIICALTLLLILASCQKPNKIGFIDNGEIVKDYEKAKDLEAKFKVKEEDLRKRLDSINTVFQTQAQKTQAEAQRIARSNRKKAEELMIGLQTQHQQLQQQMQIEQQQLAVAAQSESDSLIINIKDYIKEYAKKNQYNFILGTSDKASSVLYGTDENDLTQTILDALNAEYTKE